MEWPVVMWLNFFGLAAANAWRIAGARFDPHAVVYLSVLAIVANFVAAIARLLGSRTAFYLGLFGAILGLAGLIMSLSPDFRRPRDAGDALVRKALNGGVALSLGGLRWNLLRLCVGSHKQTQTVTRGKIERGDLNHHSPPSCSHQPNLIR